MLPDAIAPVGPPLPLVSEDYQAAHDWLLEEAAALDERRHRDWLAMLDDPVSYRMPLRVTTAAGLDTTLDEHMDHFAEDRFSLTKRVERFETEHAWTEEPPSRMRRFITNVRIYAGAVDEELYTRSYELLFRSRGDVREADLVSVERHDVLRRVDGDLKLSRRLIEVDESVLRTQNLAMFL